MSTFTSPKTMTTPSCPPETAAPLFLMLGDSLVAGYNWQQRIPQFTIKNCGVPGATTDELLSSLPRLQSHFGSPRITMVMIGTNDLVMEHYCFIEELKGVIAFLTWNFPGTEVLVNSLLPMQLRHLAADTIPRINTLIAGICRTGGCSYIDVYSRFMQSEGTLFQADGVHLTEKGYDAWVRTVIEHIAFMREND